MTTAKKFEIPRLRRSQGGRPAPAGIRLSAFMREALKETGPGEVMQPGGTRAALMRRGLVHNMLASPELRGTLTIQGVVTRNLLIGSEPS